MSKDNNKKENLNEQGDILAWDLAIETVNLTSEQYIGENGEVLNYAEEYAKTKDLTDYLDKNGIPRQKTRKEVKMQENFEKFGLNEERILDLNDFTI